jgi:hypothetical protein
MDDSRLGNEEQLEIFLVREELVVMIWKIERILHNEKASDLGNSMIALDKTVNTLSRINGRIKRFLMEV